MDNVKKLLYSTIADLKKATVSYGFVFCILITLLLCFASVVYTDSFTGKEYTVVEILLNKPRFKAYNFSSINILHYSVSPYLTIFLPVLSSLPYVTFFCTERLSGNIRFVISRVGKTAYYLSKFISAILSGGLAIMCGFILYSIIIIICFDNSSFVIYDYLKIYIGMFIYGVVSVFPAFFISSIVKNTYVICCFPFILMHFYYTSISKIQDHFIEIDKIDIVIKMNFLYPSELKEILFDGDKGMIVYYLVLAFITLIGFSIIMNRRLDYGE